MPRPFFSSSAALLRMSISICRAYFCLFNDSSSAASPSLSLGSSVGGVWPIPTSLSRSRSCLFHLYSLLFAPLGRELGGFSEWIFEVDPFIIAGELEQPQNIRWDIVRQMALYMVIIGQIDNLDRVEHIQQYTGCWAV